MMPDEGVVEYHDQSAQGLSLTVVEGEFEIPGLTVITTEELVVTQPDLRVEASIIGSSHMISYTVGRRTISEIFACAEVQAKERRVYCGPLGEVSGTIELPFRDSITYSFTPTLLKAANALKKVRQHRQWVEEARHDGNRIGLIYEFPSRDEGDIPPLTIVVVDIIKGSYTHTIRSSTVHSYPNEGTVVVTRANLTVTRQRRLGT